MNSVFRNWIIILITLTVALGFSTFVGDTISPGLGMTLRGVILLVAAGIGVADAIKRIMGQKSLLGRGQGMGRMLAIIQLIASLVLAMSLLMA